MLDLLTKTIDLQQGNPEEKRTEILNYFEKTWAIDELLYTQLKSDEVFYHRGDPLRHVLLFYFGHTAVFFINKLFLAKLIANRIDPFFESIFAIGVDEMSWDDLNEKNNNWPLVEAVREYRNKAKNAIIELIHQLPLTLPITWNDPFWIIMMGIEHVRIHLETSSVLIRQLPLEEVVSGKFGQICATHGNSPTNEYISVPGARMQLGKPNDHALYGWDNEYGSYTEDVFTFKTSKHLISNEEFRAFVEAGGYKNSSFWTEEGWNWRCFKEAEMPLFWRKNGTDYKLRLVAQEIPMPWNWPAEVNYLEAKAFCNWKTAISNETYRLPTEAEWMRLKEHVGVEDQNEWKKAPGNINLEHYASPCPVDMFQSGDFFDVIGNVWQWTETPITGYPRFKVHPLYDDFSTPTFDGKHNIIKGGSWISTGNEATAHARYAFRRHFYQHAGFRIVQSELPINIHNDSYETETDVANSCEDDWGNEYFNTPNISKVIANVAFKTMNNKHISVLDLNTNTGRLAFELSQFYDKITAVDFSARFIKIPIQLQEEGFMRYIVKDEGELVNYRDIVLADFGLDIHKNKIQFMQADANNLKPIYTGYDLIVVPNLLEELICPILFLKNIHERLNTQGVLMISSTYNWDKNNVQRQHWPGGFKADGEPISSFEGIKTILDEHFTLIDTPQNLHYTNRKSSRLVEYHLTELSCWRKK